MKRPMLAVVWVAGLFLGCSAPVETDVSPPVTLVYQKALDPVREMCMDDTFAPTDHFNVPTVRFDRGGIELKGQGVSREQLLRWAVEKYGDLPEQALWVQVGGGSELLADATLLQLAEVLPRLEFRRVDPNFKCPRTTATTRAVYNIQRCTPKIVRKPELANGWVFHRMAGDKPSGYPPLVAFSILESGTVHNVSVKRSSGYTDLDNYARQWIGSATYDRRPGCGVIDSEAVVLIHLRP
jgi:TonB family protein